VLLIIGTSIGVLVIMWVDTMDNGSTSYVAASLYIPYVLWLLFAAALNLDIALSNKTAVTKIVQKMASSNTKLYKKRYGHS